MPDIRAVHNLSQAVESARDAVDAALRRAGYDPATLETLPEPGDCPCQLAQAIRRWHDANQQLDAAWQRTTGWRR